MPIFKKFIYILLITTIMFMITGCKGKESSDRITVITTLYPQYDFVNQIGKDKVKTTLLLKPGVEPHSYDPTPKDLITIQNADLFIYTGEFMEPWAERIVQGIDSKSLKVVNTSVGITLLTEEHEEEEAEEEEEEHGEYDPHIWLDPLNAVIMIDTITQSLIEVDIENADFYTNNANAYKDEILKLHEDFVDVFSKTKYKTIIYGGHFAFGYFTNRYNLEYITPYEGFSPNIEPTYQKIEELTTKLRETGQNYIFYEELIEPRVARTISEDTGAEMILLHGVHNVTSDQIKNKVTYVSLMRENLENLKRGLEYNE